MKNIHRIRKVQQIKFSGSNLLHFDSGEPAGIRHFKQGNNYILIHGFTRNGNYLHNLGSIIKNEGGNCFIYDYNSFVGIDRAAKSFTDLIRIILNVERNINPIPKSIVITLVGHSLGGLVARAIALDFKNDNFIKAIITLGAPHRGTFRSELVSYFIDWGEKIAGYMPGADLSVRSAQQLTMTDDDLEEQYLNILAKEERKHNIPIISFSGGKNKISLSDKYLADAIANKQIQNHIMKGEINDGLVPESSSDITNLLDATSTSHINDYSDFPIVNHTNLINNQTIGLKIVNQ